MMCATEWRRISRPSSESAGIGSRVAPSATRVARSFVVPSTRAARTCPRIAAAQLDGRVGVHARNLAPSSRFIRFADARASGRTRHSDDAAASGVAIVRGPSVSTLSATSRPALRRIAVVLLALAVLAEVVRSTPAVAAPSAPQLTTISSVATNPVLSWQAVTGATGYRVQVSTTSNFSSTVFALDTINTRATPTIELPTGTLYWRVAAMDASSVGAWSSSVFTKVQGSGPVLQSPPNDATLLYPADAPALSWSPVPGAVSYRVEIDDAADFIGAEVHTTAMTALTLTEPRTPEQTFHWRVQANLSGGQTTRWSSETRRFSVWWSSDASAPETSRLQPALQSPPNRLDPPVQDIVLRWRAVPGAATYQVQISPNGEWADNVAVDVTTTGTAYSPPRTLDNGEYYWRVRARDHAGRNPNLGRWSAEWQFARGWPDRPVPLGPTGGGMVTLPTLEWTPVRMASHYEVQVSTDINFSPALIASCTTNRTTITPYARVTPLSGHGEPTSTCFGANPFHPGRTYHWRVRGVDAQRGVLGLWSNTGTHDTPSFEYFPDMPEMLSPADGAAVDTPVLRWAPAENHGRYRVTITPTRGSTITATTYATSYTPPAELKPENGPYRWTVQTHDPTNGLGVLPGEPWAFDVIAPAVLFDRPDPLPFEGGFSASRRMPSLAWTPVDGVDYYEVWYRRQGTVTFLSMAGTTRLRNAAHTHVGSSSEPALSPGDHEWFVRAVMKTGEQRNGAASTFTILDHLEVQPTAPTSCSAPGDGCLIADTPTLEWEPVNDAGGYLVYVAADPNFTNIYRTYWTMFNRLTPRESYLDSQAGQSYYWFVRPCTHGQAPPCGSFNSDDHARASSFRKRSHGVVLTAPADPTVANLPTFAWQPYLATNQTHPKQAVTQEARDYRIEVSTVRDFATVLDRQVVDQTTYTPFDRTYPEGPLYWRVQAIDGSGNNLTWSEVRELTKSTPAVSPASPANGARVSGFPVLRWAPQDFAADYVVQIARNGDTNFSPGNVVASTVTKMTAFAPNKALGSGTFAWRVQRRDAQGRAGLWSTARTFSLDPGAPALTAPAAGTSLTGALPVFSWSTVPQATTYRIETSTSATFSRTIDRVDTTMTSWAAPRVYGPARDGSPVTYYWRVHVLDAARNVLATSAASSFTARPASSPAPPPSAPTPAPPPDRDDSGTSRRLASSSDPVTAAVGLSRSVFRDGGATRVLIGRNDVFADSLAGAALAGKDGPILYTTGGTGQPLRAEVLAEVRRVLGPPKGCGAGAQVFILGGTGAVSTRAEQAIVSAGYCVKRYAGASRVETSVEIARDVVRRGGGSQVLIARSHEWADAATGGAYAAASGAPIVVTPTEALHPAVRSFLGSVRPRDIVLLGGDAALHEGVEAAVRGLGPTRRVAGPARDATAVEIARQLWAPLAPRGVVLVNGWHGTGWAYALAAAVPAAREGAVELYVVADSISPTTQAYLTRTSYRFAVSAGPPNLISDAVHRHVVAGASTP
jgi:putative cell wall-binding protein